MHGGGPPVKALRAIARRGGIAALQPPADVLPTRIFDTLMGEDVDQRRSFIEEHARYAKLDM